MSGQDYTTPVPFFHGTTDSGGPSGGLRGERETTSPARPQAPERTSWSAPGAPTEGQGERAPARPTGEARAARRRDAPSPPRGGAARKTQPGKASAESVRCVTETTGRDHHRGRAGFRTPFPFHTPPSGGGNRGEGPAGRARRAVPSAKECPSLVWRGLGPARESATSPHRSSGGAHTNAARRRGETRRRQPLGNGPDRFQPRQRKPFSFPFSSSSGTQGHRVHTNLVVQNANFRQNMDCAG